MKCIAVFVVLMMYLSSCNQATSTITKTHLSATEEIRAPEVISTFTSLPELCATPAPAELNDFIKQSITIADHGKTFTTHVTSRFWIYLDDRIYPLPELFNAIPQGLIGYLSNGSVRGPQCYPVMFEALKEGKGLLQLKDFQFEIVVDDSAPESALPLP